MKKSPTRPQTRQAIAALYLLCATSLIHAQTQTCPETLPPPDNFMRDAVRELRAHDDSLVWRSGNPCQAQAFTIDKLSSKYMLKGNYFRGMAGYEYIAVDNRDKHAYSIERFRFKTRRDLARLKSALEKKGYTANTPHHFVTKVLLNFCYFTTDNDFVLTVFPVGTGTDHRENCDTLSRVEEKFRAGQNDER